MLLELLHIVEFGILYILLMIFFTSFGPISRLKETISITISILYSVSDEIHQYYVPFRSFAIGDLIKNIIGIIFMWLLFRVLNKKKLMKTGRNSISK